MGSTDTFNIILPPSAAARIKFRCRLCGVRFFDDQEKEYERHCVKAHDEAEFHEIVESLPQHKIAGIFEDADPELSEFVKRNAGAIARGDVKM